MPAEDELIAGLRLFRDVPAPQASDALRELFASGSTVPVTVVEPARRRPAFRRILSGLPSKVAAGALGALLAGSVGAGALTGTIVLTGDDRPADDDGAVVVVEEAPAAEAEGVEDVGGGDDVVPEDVSTVPAPTAVADAARTHALDEACGTHGAYVLHVAQTGEAPDCTEPPVRPEGRAVAEEQRGGADDRTTTPSSAVRNKAAKAAR